MLLPVSPCPQVLAYNHALLSLWGTDSLVLVADVDEYVMTHKPMTVVEVRYDTHTHARANTHGQSKTAFGPKQDTQCVYVCVCVCVCTGVHSVS